MEILIFSDDGSILSADAREISFQRFSDAVDKFFNRTSQNKNNFIRIPESVTGLEGTIFYSKEKFYYIQLQNTLSINTWWKPYKSTDKDGKENVIFIPSFKEKDNCIEQKVDFFLVPHFLYFIYVEDAKNQDNYALYSPIVQENENDKTIRTYYLALPGIFENSRVCLGDKNTIVGSTFAERAQCAIRIFNESVYHNDDLYDYSKEKKVMAFSVDHDFKPLQNVYDGALLFNNNEINELIKAFLEYEE